MYTFDAHFACILYLRFIMESEILEKNISLYCFIKINKVPCVKYAKRAKLGIEGSLVSRDRSNARDSIPLLNRFSVPKYTKPGSEREGHDEKERERKRTGSLTDTSAANLPGARN